MHGRPWGNFHWLSDYLQERYCLNPIRYERHEGLAPGNASWRPYSSGEPGISRCCEASWLGRVISIPRGAGRLQKQGCPDLECSVLSDLSLPHLISPRWHSRVPNP